MADFKLVMNDPKTGKSFNGEVKDEAAAVFIGKKIGDTVKGDSFDMNGYEFEISGGSDNCGFPMRKDIDILRKKILAVEGVGLKKKGEGIRQRKTVSGNKIHTDISQINLKIVKFGKQKLGEEAVVEEKSAEEVKPEIKEETKAKAKPVEEVKPESKEETKPEAKEEEKKEEPKVEDDKTPVEENSVEEVKKEQKPEEKAEEKASEEAEDKEDKKE